MSKGKSINKLKLCRQHREDQYLHTLNKLIDGKAGPEEVAKRFEKLKAVRKE